MKHGFIKTAAATPCVRIADPSYNTAELIRLAKDAAEHAVDVLVFPELCISGYTCGDLFCSNSLLAACRESLACYARETADLRLLSVVGLPLEVDGRLYDCAAAVCNGEILGIVPKSSLPAFGAFAETRHFSPAPQKTAFVTLGDREIPFGADLVFACREMPLLRLTVQIGADGADGSADAPLICVPAASCELVGNAETRKLILRAESAKKHAAVIYASCGAGESTTDAVFGGHCLICENGTALAERKPFDAACEWICSEPDLERLAYDRRTKSRAGCADAVTVPFSLPLRETALTRKIAPQPFIPEDAEERSRRCEHILAIQAHGLQQRIQRAYAQKLVIGISGGLDSTLALLVAARALDLLGRPHTDILAVTMPCFGTTKRTKNNATVLCEELGTDFRCVDIFDAVNVHFRDIGHDPADRNVTYENSQARERTQILMDIANDCNGMVIGTGDLSELALGWATYNGDHMSMYGVNGDVPKTLVRHLVAYCADESDAKGNTALAGALRDVLDTPVSPELLPADENGDIAQKTEDLVGPYEIHDFYLYYLLRFGFSPEKLYRMAKYALGDRYDAETLKKWLRTFLRRFFTQQFKRSCLPDGPKVGSVGISPRGDWQMPSDASSALWLAEADTLE